MTNSEGLLIEQPTPPDPYHSGQCRFVNSPGGDWYSFKGIFLRHLGYFVSEVGHLALNASQLTRIHAFVKTNADAVWNFASASAPFPWADVCNENQDFRGTEPWKFHWQWHWQSHGPNQSAYGPLCMDARAQGSAANLFMTEYILSRETRGYNIKGGILV